MIGGDSCGLNSPCAPWVSTGGSPSATSGASSALAKLVQRASPKNTMMIWRVM